MNDPTSVTPDRADELSDAVPSASHLASEPPCPASANGAETVEGPLEASPAAEATAAAQRPDALLHNLLESLESRLAGVATAIGEMASQMSLIPRQVRQLSAKVEAVETSVAEPRCRALLLGLLGIYDLLDPLVRGNQEADAADADHRRNYQVLHTQLRQLLESNGLTEIPTDGEFDPHLHRAVERAACSDPRDDNLVLRVVRPGFRTGQAVLRYAEVVVGHHEPRAEEPPK